MEGIDLGRYRDTGLVQFTTGFNHSHLAEVSDEVIVPEETRTKIDAALIDIKDKTGSLSPIVEKPEESVDDFAPEPEVVEFSPDVFVPQEDIDESNDILEQQVIGNLPNDRPYVTPINEDHSPVNYTVNEEIYVHELSEKRKPKLLKQSQAIQLSYTIEVRDLTYGVPGIPYELGLTFLVPLNKVTADDDLFNADMSLREKTMVGSKLSPSEEVWTIFSRISAKGYRIKSWFTRK